MCGQKISEKFSKLKTGHDLVLKAFFIFSFLERNSNILQRAKPKTNNSKTQSKVNKVSRHGRNGRAKGVLILEAR